MSESESDDIWIHFVFISIMIKNMYNDSHVLYIKMHILN